MVGNLKSKRQEGFTIIEVLIVLAIAGLIMLIVFLAVPALQRNSRNTQRKNDAASIGSAISSYITNNGGKLPTLVAGDGTNTNNLVISSTPSANVETAKLGYYITAVSATGAASTADIFISTGTATAPVIGAPVASSATETALLLSSESISMWTKYKCNADSNGLGAYSPRSVAVLYVVESGTGNGSIQCLEQ